MTLRALLTINLQHLHYKETKKGAEKCLTNFGDIAIEAEILHMKLVQT